MGKGCKECIRCLHELEGLTPFTYHLEHHIDTCTYSIVLQAVSDAPDTFSLLPCNTKDRFLGTWLLGSGG